MHISTHNSTTVSSEVDGAHDISTEYGVRNTSVGSAKDPDMAECGDWPALASPDPALPPCDLENDLGPGHRKR